jgi:DnaJ-class molecular chaperone
VSSNAWFTDYADRAHSATRPADKNAHRVAESTAYFSSLQEAYEILIDPQERAFYDRNLHKTATGSNAESNVSSAEFDEVLRGQREVPRPSGRGMGVNELMRFFEKRVWEKGGLGDKPGVSPSRWRGTGWLGECR